MKFGCDPDKWLWPGHRSTGGHIHIGYTGWHKRWEAIKGAVLDYWNFWRPRWKLACGIVLMAILVQQIAQGLGVLSVYLGF